MLTLLVVVLLLPPLRRKDQPLLRRLLTIYYSVEDAASCSCAPPGYPPPADISVNCEPQVLKAKRTLKTCAVRQGPDHAERSAVLFLHLWPGW